MIAKFNDEGNLPTGIYMSKWEEFVKRFGINYYRTKMIRGLVSALNNLKYAGCSKVYIDGSFVTSKSRPRDYDACWDFTNVDLSKLDPVLLNMANGRKAQKSKYFGEFFPINETNNDILNFFQRDKESGNSKGIVCINLEELS